MKPLSQTVEAIPPSGIRKYFDVAAQIEDCISLGVGEPDFVTPWHIREAAIWCIEKGYTSYTSNYGRLTLREKIAEHLSRMYRVDYNPASEVLVTVGVSEGLDLALRCILNPGDEVLVFDPGYVSYQPGISLAGGIAVPVPCDVQNGFQPSVENAARLISPRTKCILLGFPSNPTGVVPPRDVMQALVDLAEAHDLYIISDEIYDRLIYGKAQHTCVPSLAGARDRTVLLGGFSKAYAMTGWRLGWACAPPHIIELMLKIHQYTMLCAPIAAQMAAEEALFRGEPEVQRMVAEYDRRRRLIVKRLNDMGLTCVEPEGAFYVFPSIRSTGLTSEQFVERLLREHRVAVVPGNVFGESGEGHVRMSYATSTAKIEEAMRRIGAFLAEVRPDRVAATAV